MNSNFSVTDDLWQSTLRLFSGTRFPSSVPGFPARARAAARARSRLAAVPRRRAHAGIALTQLPEGAFVDTELLRHSGNRARRLDHHLHGFILEFRREALLRSGQLLSPFQIVHPNGWTVRKVRGTSGAVAGEHLGGGAAVEFPEVAFGSAAVQPGVAEVVPEPVRVHGHPGWPAAAGDGLVDAGRGERPPAVRAEPELGPPGLRVPGAGPQVAVEAAGRLVADLDGPGRPALCRGSGSGGLAGSGRCGRGRRGGCGSRPARTGGCRWR